MEEVQQTTLVVPDIVLQAQKYLGDFIDQNHRSGFVFHNYALIHRAVERAKVILETEQATAEVKEISLLACWFVKIGYWINYEQPVASTLREVGKFFNRTNYPENKRKRLVQCLQTVASQRIPLKVEEKVVTDAYTITEMLEYFTEQGALHRLEQKLHLNKIFSDEDWQLLTQEKLQQLRLYTSYAKVHFATQKGQCLLQLQQKIAKKNKKVGQFPWIFALVNVSIIH